MILQQKIMFFAFILVNMFLLGSKEVHGLTGKRLFVFGNSYVDTGNTPSEYADSWKAPYGSTYPGKPTGRFSDGRVWSDFIAQHLKLSSPVPFEQRNQQKKTTWNRGINFAYGGTGVFPTAVPLPTMSKQINNFRAMIKQKVYKPKDLLTSVALISVAGDDLNYLYLQRKGNVTEQEFHALQDKVVAQTMTNINRIAGLGVKSIAVDSLQPLGCLPSFSASFRYRSCYQLANNLSVYQNTELLGKMRTLAKQKPKTNFYYLDMFTAWNTVLNITQYIPWTPCCVGTSRNATCSSTGVNGTLLYSVCGKLNSTFYWDKEHPTQAGWNQIYLSMDKPFKPLR